jgi:hypothetical protein
MNPKSVRTTTQNLRSACVMLAIGAGLLLPSSARVQDASAAKSLEETRLVMNKWIETQQIISKERNEWQQGKEILVGRLDVVRKEVSTLEEKIQQAQTSVADAEKKRAALVADNDQFKSTGARLTQAVTRMEGEIRRLHKMLPEPVQERLQPLFQRIPEDPEKTRASAAERFQNVLGILNEVNKANYEINVNYEVRNLSDGKPAEVQAVYVGLAQAYFVSPHGDAGIGRPGADGWLWEPAKSIAGAVLSTVEMIQGKQSPAFVPLPVKLK